MSDQLYLYTITLFRPQAAEQPTPDEEAVFERHFRHLQALCDEGILLLAGPCTDGAFGIVIVRAENARAAESLMQKDPAVAEGLMRGEIHPFRASLVGQI